MLSKKTVGIKKIQQMEPKILCPQCSEPLKCNEKGVVFCSNQHSFDVARQGYLNLAPQHNEKHYTKNLFKARQFIMGDLKLYDGLYTLILNLLGSEGLCLENTHLLDLGTGEGSHLQLLYNEWMRFFPRSKPRFIGLDLSKEGIITATKYYKDPLFLVADLGHIPLTDSSMDGSITILSPSNYKEIKRVLKDCRGWLLKIIPGPMYLRELREKVSSEDKMCYDSSQTLYRFRKHFPYSYKKETFYNRTPITKEELRLLIQMTPLMWHIDEEKIEQILCDINHITIDLTILFAFNSN